jgi:tRNA A37 threonylcarbamoyladenosine dehydratase
MNAVNSIGPGVIDAGLTSEPDLERRFGGLRRLYGDGAYRRIRNAHVVVVGVGGVGSWSAEALARSGVAALTLIDLDHVSESNINRQVQALDSTLGKAKVDALRDRIAEIHPGCKVNCIDEFVDQTNWVALLADASTASKPDVVIDACDQVRAKGVLAAWALATGNALIVVGAAGGKRRPQAVEADDLSRVTHDPLLASLRQQLRRRHGAARVGEMGLRCVFSREAVMGPSAVADSSGVALECVIGGDDGDANDGTLNCHGYGSSVAVTATFGMVAAGEALETVARLGSARIKSMPVAVPNPVAPL